MEKRAKNYGEVKYHLKLRKKEIIKEALTI
jgi:hypothetical protein